MSEHEKAGADRAVDLLAENKQLQTEKERLKLKIKVLEDALAMIGAERNKYEEQLRSFHIWNKR